MEDISSKASEDPGDLRSLPGAAETQDGAGACDSTSNTTTTGPGL